MISIKALIILIIQLLTMTSGQQCISEVNIYPQTFVVTEVSHENNTITLEDFNGNVWVYDGCEDWAKGDIASALMTDNGTVEIYDDAIITLKYSGY